MKKIILILTLIAPVVGFGQCIVGDCENGEGAYLWEDGSICNGSWKNGNLHGSGVQIVYDEGVFIGVYDGGFNEGTISGWGTETLYDDDGLLLGTYVGNWADDNYNGWGIWIWDDGTIEKGIYKDGNLIP